MLCTACHKPLDASADAVTFARGRLYHAGPCSERVHWKCASCGSLGVSPIMPHTCPHCYWRAEDTRHGPQEVN